MILQFKNTFDVLHQNTTPVEVLYKNLAHRVETHLSREDFRVVLGANPTRWRAWNNSLCPLHLIYRQRFVIFNVTFVNVIPFGVPVWKLAISFLYHLSIRRHPKILFVGNPMIEKLSTYIVEYIHAKYHLYYVRAIDYWVPGFVGNIKSMFLPFEPRQKGEIRDVRGVRLSNVGTHRGQAYVVPYQSDTYRFLYNYFFPECVILLNSSFRAYNADKEVLKKGLPAIALSSSDTKTFGFSGCFYTLPAGVNYEDHLHFYMFLFYVVVAYARSKFLYREYLSLRTNVFMSLKRTLPFNRKANVRLTLHHIHKIFLLTYQKLRDNIKRRFLDFESLDVAEEDARISTLPIAILARKLKRWYIVEEDSAETRKRQEVLLFTRMPGRETVIISDHLKKDARQKLYDEIYLNLNKAARSFQFLVSIILLQHLFTGGGKTFVGRGVAGVKNNIFLFLNTPGCRMLQRFVKLVHDMHLSEPKARRERFKKKIALSTNITFLQRKLRFVESMFQYNRAVIQNLARLKRSRKTSRVLRQFGSRIRFQNLHLIYGNQRIRNRAPLGKKLTSFAGPVRIRIVRGRLKK